MFEVNGVYANRRGKYTVLKLNGSKMTVRFEDGSLAELKTDLQARIWENIRADFEAKEASRQARPAKRAKIVKDTQNLIKIISVPTPSELAFAGWTEKVILGAIDDKQFKLNSGDRIIFYAIETKTFFAVATVTGDAKVADPKKYFFTVDVKKADFYPIDIDASATKLTKGTDAASVELESQPNFGKLQLTPEQFLEINEDDFELLSEALTEIVEDEEEEGTDDSDDEIYEEDDD
ncbi:MAG: hypothetical protein GY943_26750 [Chloroflexi bacterium]|nr:hypothetical protein [Chloroflexota bacterium]